jgi:hypothetical protein
MNHKDKANQLVDGMLYELKYNCQPSITQMVAKQCAKLAVDEVIESRKDDKSFDDSLNVHSGYYSSHPMYLTYWLKVKEEIEKL